MRPVADKPARKPDPDQESGWWVRTTYRSELLAKAATAVGWAACESDRGRIPPRAAAVGRRLSPGPRDAQLIWKGIAEHRERRRADDVCALFPDARSEITADNHLVIVVAVKTCIRFSPTS